MDSPHGFVQTTSFSTSMKKGGSCLTTSFFHRTALAPETSLAGHPLIVFAYLTPPSLHLAKLGSIANHVGFFFFGPGVKKEFAVSVFDQMRTAIGKKHP
jgi:hypothetical protein